MASRILELGGRIEKGFYGCYENTAQGQSNPGVVTLEHSLMR